MGFVPFTSPMGMFLQSSLRRRLSNIGDRERSRARTSEKGVGAPRASHISQHRAPYITLAPATQAILQRCLMQEVTT